MGKGLTPSLKDLRTTSIALLIAILASSSPIYGVHVIPSVVHAAGAAPTISVSVGATSVTATASGTGFLAYYISVQNYAAGNAGIGNGHTIATNPCVNSITTTAGIRSGTVFDHAVVRVLTCDGATHPDGKEYTATFSSSGVPTDSIQVATVTPGSGQIRIHEFNNCCTVDQAMQAFQAGSIDMVDWDIPTAYLNNWNNCAGPTPIGPNCNGQITIHRYTSGNKFEIDMNENGTRVASQAGFRQAMGYLVDRQNIVNAIAGPFAEPICSFATPEQVGGASCQSLGYPSQYGDYNPTKALQTLYESGWRFDSGDGFLYGPALPGSPGIAACNSIIPGQTGNFCVRPIIFLIRSDDSIRSAAAQAMASIMQNLPNQFCSKSGGTINPIPPCQSGSVLTTVCPTAPCKLSLSLNIASASTVFKTIYYPPWNRWDMYTGGHGGDIFAALYLVRFYDSADAPVADCGQWLGTFPLNIGGFCNSSYDAATRQIFNASTVQESNAAAMTAQQIAWGYSATQGKITGLEPSVPMYTLQGAKAEWLRDVGAGLTTNGTSTTTAFFNQRACRQDIIGNGLGSPFFSLYENVIGVFDDNCAGNTAGHVSYLGNTNSVLDWGFAFPLFYDLNPITTSGFTEPIQQTYDTILGFNPANPSELKPILCSDSSVGTYVNTHNNAPASYLACRLRTDLFWSDGVPLTAQDVAFSIDYAAENESPYYSYQLTDLCGPNFGPYPFYSPTNCGDGVQIVNNSDGSQTIVFYFDYVSWTLTTGDFSLLFNPIIPKHIFCNDWTSPVAGKLGPGVKATSNCLFPDAYSFPSEAGLSDGTCTDCPAFPGYYLNASYPPVPVPIPSYLSSIGYGSTIKNWLTGSGPYKITSCGGDAAFNAGTGCGGTILLTANPYWHDGIRMASPGTGDGNDATGQRGGLALQPDLNRDSFVNSQDLALAQSNGAGNSSDWRYSADFRQGPTGDETIMVPSSVCSQSACTIVAGFTGWPGTSTDTYIIQKLIQEGVRLGLCVTSGSDPCASGGVSWPPPSGSVTNKNGYLPPGVVGSMSYIWPDSSGASAGVPDGTVNVNDLIYVFTHQFLPVTDTTGNLIPRSPYNADVTHDGIIDIHDLIATLTREFTQPAGIVP